MMLKRSTTESQPSSQARLVRAGLAGLAAAGAAAALVTGCLDRPVVQQEPTTSNVFVDQIVQNSVDKIDLLFMIDNSASMADKQDILRDAVPVLVGRLIDPICVSTSTGLPTTGTNSTPCAADSQPEFSPIGDIHIGIVSSSLGSHGGSVCSTGAGHLNDNGHLIGSARADNGFPVTDTWNSSGFLAWDSTQTADNPPGDNSASHLESTFQNMVVASAEDGCGFESQLEGWYRFLIDPEPPANVTLDTATNSTVRGSVLTVNADGTTGACTGCDQTVLAQRKAFLRPDSLVAVVMLTDENDCSIRDDGVGWFVGSSSPMPRATAVCATNPNDPCCRSCAQNETSPPAGCMALSADPVCKNVTAGQPYATWAGVDDGNDDAINLRCYNQRQRFGFDLLYPTSRYVAGLSQKMLPLQSNPAQVVTNPLFDETPPRDPSLVFLAGIVGVPWQDISDAASLSGAGLTYLTAAQLAAADPTTGKSRWDYLLGSPAASPPIPPLDPFMIESIPPRSGVNPFTNDPIVAATSTMAHASPINGHEWNPPSNSDLQYACISPLGTPKDCTQANSDSCDCSPDAKGSSAALVTANSPLCQGGTSINQQTSFKGYPGARELQVLKDFGDNAIVASICPKVTAPTTDPSYGYNPAVSAIIERLKAKLSGQCLPRPIQTDSNPASPTYGQVLCKVIEAQKSGCDCTIGGRGPADPSIASAVDTQLGQTGNCGGPGQVACSTWCQCEIKQLTGADLVACQSDSSAAPAGYCYIDASAETLNGGVAKSAVAAQLAKCPANEQQLLRFVDADSSHKTPAAGAVAFIACLGAPVVTVAGTGGGN